MADLATAFVGASAGVSCVSRDVTSAVSLRFIGASLQQFHCVSLGRHFSGFIGASLRRFHCEFRGGYETLPLGCGTERALPSPFTKTFSRAISATFSDHPHHFVTVSGRSSREHCVRDARGGACPCHVGSFPFHGLRSVY